MVELIHRKCAVCNNSIEIDRHHISNIVFYKKKYYHSICFRDLAIKRSQSKSKLASEWRDAIDNLWKLEMDARKMLEHRFYSDELNEWLLNHYDVSVVPGAFWQVIAGLESGTYKGKMCKPISIGTLLECWKWGQKKLDEIKQYNKVNHKGPDNDNARLMYDLAILIGKMPNYLAYKAKQEAAEAERQMQLKENIDIDYSKIKVASSADGLGDISDLLDEI